MRGGLRVQRLAGQLGHLLLEELRGPGPHGVVLPVVELQQVGQEVVAERLRGLARQQTRKVVDADDAQRWVLQALYGDGGLLERGGDGVDGDWAQC